MQKMELFNDGDTTVDDLIKQYNVDLQNVALCKKIRQLGKLNRIKLDTTEHRSGLNKHLLQYLYYCNIDPLEYIKDYLSNLQPYMIERRQDQEKFPGAICILDNIYRISLYIKVDATQFEEVIVSFHVNNKNGIAKDNSKIATKIPDYVPVFADCITSRISETNKVSIKIFMQRGVLTLPINVAAYMYNDIFIVYRPYIENSFVEVCNEYLRELYTSDLDLDFSKISIFSALQQISFTSYGKDTFSTFSLLIDNLEIQHDYLSRKAADFALVTFAEQLHLTKEQKIELLDTLNKYYSVSAFRDINIILQRVSDILINVDEPIIE